MDKITHFIFLIALILVIICCSIWLMGSSCIAGYLSVRRKLPLWLQNFYNDAQNIADTAGQHYKEVRSDLDDIVQAAKESRQSETLAE